MDGRQTRYRPLDIQAEIRFSPPAPSLSSYYTGAPQHDMPRSADDVPNRGDNGVMENPSGIAQRPVRNGQRDPAQARMTTLFFMRPFALPLPPDIHATAPG